MKEYGGRLTRTLSQIENWCKKFFEDEDSREWLYQHTEERTYTEIYESVVVLANLREELIEWVRE